MVKNVWQTKIVLKTFYKICIKYIYIEELLLLWNPYSGNVFSITGTGIEIVWSKRSSVGTGTEIDPKRALCACTRWTAITRTCTRIRTRAQHVAERSAQTVVARDSVGSSTGNVRRRERGERGPVHPYGCTTRASSRFPCGRTSPVQFASAENKDRYDARSPACETL